MDYKNFGLLRKGDDVCVLNRLLGSIKVFKLAQNPVFNDHRTLCTIELISPENSLVKMQFTAFATLFKYVTTDAVIYADQLLIKN